MPIKEIAENYAKTQKTQRNEILKKCNLQQDPLDKTIWDELTKWLKTNIGHIFNYILSMKAL